MRASKSLLPVTTAFASNPKEQSELLAFAGRVRRRGKPDRPGPMSLKGVTQIDWRDRSMSFSQFQASVRGCASLEPNRSTGAAVRSEPGPRFCLTELF